MVQQNKLKLFLQNIYHHQLLLLGLLFRIIESCYWHCYGKWHFDEEIAMYEEECLEKKKDSKAVDNPAFWDSVAVLARESVIVNQPIMERPPSSTPILSPIRITIDSPDSSTSLPNKRDLNLTDEEKCVKFSEVPTEKDTINKYRKKSLIEERIEKKLMPPQRQRKKSLKERRNSTADLTLDLSIRHEDFHDIPITRQESMPKFYTSYTPEYNPFAENPLASPIIIKTTPQYDLKSIVNIEKEIELSIQEHNREKRTSSRMANIRRKMAPILVKKASSKSLPDTINHI